ncbi:MAG: Ribosomal RNA small subunit methyltransferase A [Eubacteriales bacterium SKADARSKE-1]|nr:Ribosomal RNA small subunit methyltransferase A [Eubacteriales bacterium SKADARSKE-1]
MNNLSDINTIKAILSRHKFNFSHSLGQNFIVNPNVCPEMAALSGAGENVGVLEIGPGIGVLTRELAALAQKVVSVELDQRLLPILDETLAGFSNVKIINGDILKLDLSKIIQDEFYNMDVVVCANLPYYITSPVITKLIEEKLTINSITIMVQKEVANRICAGAGHKETSAFSIFINYYCNAEFLFDVKKENFIPSPKVDSAVIKLNIKKGLSFNVADEKTFFKVVKAAFLQRRKTVSNSLSSGLGISKEKILEVLKDSQIEPNSRAENLSMQQFFNLSNIIFKEFIK